MPGQSKDFLNIVSHPLRFRIFLLTRLPSAFFSGLKVQSIDADSCSVSVPYRWFTKNPFRSTYFACLAMAAEMSTGALVMSYTHGLWPSLSMLVTRMEAGYFKKALGRTKFICEEGQLVSELVDLARVSGEGQTIPLRTTGWNEQGEKVAEFLFTWSLKARKNSG